MGWIPGPLALCLLQRPIVAIILRPGGIPSQAHSPPLLAWPVWRPSGRWMGWILGPERLWGAHQWAAAVLCWPAHSRLEERGRSWAPEGVLRLHKWQSSSGYGVPKEGDSQIVGCSLAPFC